MDRGQLELLNLALELKTANMRLAVLVDRYLKMTRKRKARTVWVRHWITLRPHQGAYANLMTILMAEDVESFKNFTRLSPQMFADMVHRLNPRLQKYHTWYREPLSVGLKLAITLRYRRQLLFSHVSLLRAPQHHLRVGEGDVPGDM